MCWSHPVRKYSPKHLPSLLHTFAKRRKFRALRACEILRKCGVRSALLKVTVHATSTAFRKTGNMSCRDTIHLICWYLEHRLSPNVEDEISEHLHGCSDCRLVLEAATHTLDRYFGSGLTGEPATASRAA
jgi:hypothetical protein